MTDTEKTEDHPVNDRPKLVATLYGSDTPDYRNKIDQIMALYNKQAFLKAKPEFNSYETTRILMIFGVPGGLILEKHDKGFFRIMFAVFPPEHQRKGLLKACLQHAENTGIDVAIVDVDLPKKNSPWQKLGFTEQGMVGSSFCLIKPHLFETYGIKKGSSETGFDMKALFQILFNQGKK